jgi:hypothetical protein
MAESPAQIIDSACAMELKRVRTADGRFLGRIFDLRCHWDPDTRALPVVDQIVFGRGGLWERMGLRRTQPRFIHWYLVESVEETSVIVSSSRQ